MNVIQIGILLQLIGTIFVILVASIFLSPEIIGSRVPNYVVRALTRFASRLQHLMPEQFIMRIRELSLRILRFALLGLTYFILNILLVAFLAAAANYGSTLFLTLGVITGVLEFILVACVMLLPAFSLKATRQRGTWDKGRFTATEEAHPMKISRLRFARRLVFPALVLILFTYLWPFWLLALLILGLAFAWRSVMQFLATEKAPRIIALFIGFGVLLAGLIIEFIGTS